MMLFKSRIGVAIIGALAVGLVSAGLAVVLANRPPSPPSAAAASSISQQSTSSSGSAPTPTPTLSGSGSGGQQGSAQPTDTPVPPSTVPTSGPASVVPPQVLDLHGTISNLDTTNDTFTLIPASGGTLMTVHANGSTQYQGDARNFSQLRDNWKVEVVGTSQGSYVLAAQINADSGN
jgi:hypothetical protein